MIRGSIEVASAEQIQGWIYTEDGTIKDRLILAFQADRCVGSGRVGLFRADLAEAGLGDGRLGFSFPISVEPKDVGAVVVKLEGSDAVLLQPGARIGGEVPASSGGAEDTQRRLASLKWALKRGRISQSDFDFLRILLTFGAYERSLVRRNLSDDSTILDDPTAVASELLEIQAACDLNVEITTIKATELAGLLERIARSGAPAPVVALWSKQRCGVRIFENSHVESNGATELAALRARSVEYVLSSENLLFLDARIHLEDVSCEGGELTVIAPAQILG